MSATSLYRLHFGPVHSVNLNHPAIEAFFTALAEEYRLEDILADGKTETEIRTELLESGEHGPSEIDFIIEELNEQKNQL